MENLKSWILENKEWIWYAIIPIAIFIVGLIWNNKNKANQKQRIGNNSKGYQAGGDIKINEK
mgnify:CR=1 FL=1